MKLPFRYCGYARIAQMCCVFINIFTLTYVKRHPNCDFRIMLRKQLFLLQMGDADYQNVTNVWICQESREGLFTLQ